ncbi:MAG: hypothetical protein SH808_13755 [Saprospiraceae bacterium]|nr:hypothetical protein [Saprospiraceae bacterium]
MENNEQKRSGETIYQVDESIFSPQMESRLELPGDEEVIFEEVQPFDQIGIWLLLGLELAIIIIVLLVSGQPIWTVALGLGAMTLTMALLGSLKLYTRIDSIGVHFRMKPFHLREQSIPWEEIDQIHVRTYSAILEYGGWGMRIGRKGKAYNVRGNDGIQIVKKNGKKVLIGTQRPEEASRHLSGHPLLV